VTEFVRHRNPDRLYCNLANAAVYVLNRDILRFIPTDRASDFGGDVFPAALAAGAELRGHRLETEGMVKDMGTPRRKEEVEKYLTERALAAKARAHPAAVDTVFVDRDGTLNREVGHIVKPEELQLLPGAAAAIARLNRAAVKVVVVTNQPVLARGLCSTEDLEAIHAKLREELAREGGRIDAIYYCPHHPETHHGAGVLELRRGCECRKPAAGLIFRAVREHPIELSHAVMVGDRASDIRAGRRAGVRTVLVGIGATRQRESVQCPPDAEFASFAEFVEALLAGKIFSS
jgi:histidinol-phosphate phosphatase family protein